MTPWRWFAGELDNPVYDLACDCLTREDAIREGSRYLKAGDRFRIIEVRSSEDIRYADFDCVPFLRRRNQEVITVGPRLVATHPETGGGHG